MARIPQITEPEGLNDAQRAVYDSIAGGARGGVRGPFTVLLNNPELARRVEKLGVYVRYECSVPERLRELAIVIVAAHWRADYEWFAHAGLARRQGHSEDVLSAIAAREMPPFDNPADRAVHDYCKQLLQDGRVGEVVYRAAEAELGSEGIVDLTGLLGYYSLLAMTLNAFEVEPPDSTGIPWRR